MIEYFQVLHGQLNERDNVMAEIFKRKYIMIIKFLNPQIKIQFMVSNKSDKMKILMLISINQIYKRIKKTNQYKSPTFSL